MPNIVDFITSQFKKSGTVLTAEMNEMLNNPELTKINLDDNLVKQHNEKLMTLDVAKANPILKQHFKAESLDPLDKGIETLLSEYGILEGSPELATAIRNEKSTYERIPMLAKAIKELESKKATATVGDKKVLNEEIDRLNKEVVSVKASFKADIDRIIAENKAKEKDWNISGSLAAYNYSDDKYADKSEAIDLAKIKLSKQLNIDGAQVLLDQYGNLVLVSSADPSLPFTKENQKVSYKEYIDKLVADNKMIKTSDSGNGGNQSNPGTPAPAFPFNGNPETVPNVAQQDILRELANQMGNGVPV